MKTHAAANDFLQSRLARNLSPVTVDWYRQRLRAFADACPELPEDPGPITAYLATTHGVPETKHAHFRALRAFFNFVSERYGVPNPMVKGLEPRRPKKVMATLEAYELMKLLSSASNLRDKAILTLFVDTGIRTGECAGLRKQDIGENTVMVRGKSGEHEVPICEETRMLLLALVAQGSKSEHLFLGHKGPLERHGIYRIVCAHMKKAGMTGPKLGAHRIRHAFGKGYLVNGGDIRSLQQIMGHANITTTEKYTSLNLNDLTKKHLQFTPLKSAQAAAQGLLASEAIEEAEAIFEQQRHPERRGNAG